jgi:hypothetical protein
LGFVPNMTDSEMRRRMAREVLAGTKDRLHGDEANIPIGWDPVAKTIRTAMPVLRVVPDDPPDRAGKSPGPPSRRS